MSSLWSRARPKISACYRRCRCFTCLAAPEQARLLRRPASSTKLANWRRLTVFFYSTVFISGSVVESERKRRRRLHLDSAIAQAEQDVHRGRARQVRRLAALAVAQDAEAVSSADAGEYEEYEEYGTPLSAAGSSVAPAGVGEEHLSDPADTPAHAIPLPLRIRGRRPLNALKYTNLEKMDPDTMHVSSVYAEHDRTRPRRPYMSLKKQAIWEFATAKLATKMLLAVESAPQYVGPAESAQYFRSLRQSLTRLSSTLDRLKTADSAKLREWSGPIHPPHYPQYTLADDESLQSAKDLDTSTRSILLSCQKGQVTLAQAVLKIAHNLLVSPSPPTVPTITLLLSAFSRIQSDPANKKRAAELANHMIEYVDDTQAKYDELLYNAMLRHYIRTYQPDAFHNLYLKGSRFSGGQGLTSIPAGTETPHMRRYRGNALEGVKPDVVILSTLINGYLKFGQLSRALSAYRQLMAQGVTPDLWTERSFLVHFMKQRDWPRALQTWRHIRDNHLQHSIPSEYTPESAETASYQAALSLLKKSGRSKEFTTAYQEALGRGIPLHALLCRRRTEDNFVHCAGNLKRKVRVFEKEAELHSVATYTRAYQVLTSLMIIDGISLENIQQGVKKYLRQQSSGILDKALVPVLQGVRQRMQFLSSRRGSSLGHGDLQTFAKGSEADVLGRLEELRQTLERPLGQTLDQPLEPLLEESLEQPLQAAIESPKELVVSIPIEAQRPATVPPNMTVQRRAPQSAPTIRYLCDLDDYQNSWQLGAAA